MRYYLGFYADDTSREGYSVFYSKLFQAENEKEALEKWYTDQCPGPAPTDPDELEDWNNRREELGVTEKKLEII